MKKVEVRKSRIAGRGIFATKDIRKGEFVMRMEGRITKRVYRTKSDYKGEELFVPIAMHWWLDPKPPLRFTNHSCDPNAGFKSPRRVYAMRNIRKGEEVTLDYSTIEYFVPWSMRCACGTRLCRKTVGSIQSLPLKRFKAYIPYIPRFMQKVYIESRRKGRIK